MLLHLQWLKLKLKKKKKTKKGYRGNAPSVNIKSLMHICSLYYVVCDKLLDSLIPKKFKTQLHLTAPKDNFSQVF